MASDLTPTALDIVEAVRAKRIGASAVLEATLARIRARDGALNCFTRLLDQTAREDAEAVDRVVASGRDPGPLAGVPFAVKDLFDVAGEPTTAGAAIRVNAAPACRDATAVARLRAAGAVLVGTLNMDEFAYGFVTENAHFGTTRNPHDPMRIAGGSSGGSAAAVGAGLVPLTLGSDTNGSIRVPASLCGVYGLRATHASIDVTGSFPLVEAFDVVGPFAGTLADLQLAYEVLVGTEVRPRSAIKVGRLGGWFRRNGDIAVLTAIDIMAEAFSAPLVDLVGVDAARSAAFVITAAEAGARHLDDLRLRALHFDPATRDRLIAGALVPEDAVADALRLRDRFRAQVESVLEKYDVLIAPATPCVAPPAGVASMEIDGELVSARANLGLYTQPLTLAGVPVMSVPLARDDQLPLGVQLIGAPDCEATLFSFARVLEQRGFIGSAPAGASRC